MMSTKTEEATPSRKLKRKRDEFYEGGVSPQKKLHTFPVQPTAPSLEAQEQSTSSRRCGREFFDTPCEQLARNLLGCALIREAAGQRCWGRIVETEAYLGGPDKAAHSYNGKRTERNEAMYMPPGTAYVYSIYGMHCCFNISSRGGGAAVLIRALEPLGGVAGMTERRKGVKKERDLCNGPAKLCKAMGIDKKSNKIDLLTSDVLWVELPEEGACSDGDLDVVESGRIGVDYAEEWADKPLRFHVKDCPFVSKTGKK